MVLASVVDYTKRSLPFSVAVTIRCARLVIPLEDGVGGTTGPAVVLLTRLLVWRRSITLLEVGGALVVGWVGVVVMVVGGRGATLAVAAAVRLVVMRRSNI